MTNKEKIVECLEKEYPNTLSSSEISKREGIQIDMMYIYLNNLNKKGKVVRENDKKPYQYKANTYKALVKEMKFLMDFFQKNSEMLQNKNNQFFKESQKRFQYISNIIRECDLK